MSNLWVIATVEVVRSTVLRHELLEDERRWALIFGAVALVTSVLVSTFDVDEESIPRLLAVSLLPVAYYGARAWIVSLPAWPIVAVAGLAQVVAGVVDGDAEGHAFGMLLALFYLFFREPKRPTATAIAIFAVPLPLILTAVGLLAGDGWLYWTMGNLICLWFGVLAHDLRLVALELDRQRAEAIEGAVASERQRIARDVHDLVGHSLSVMMLHLTAARRTVSEQPERAVDALHQAEHVGRDAMSEIRRTIGMLSDDTADHQAELVTDPVPGLGDLGDLVSQYRDAGLDVDLNVEGDHASLDGARSLAAYRIVQESLVNASKHTIGSKVNVDARQTAGGWTIQVVNRGGSTTTRAERSAATVPSSAPNRPTGRGLGLIGMRERARSVNGSFEAGPTNDGWRVEATLPGEMT